MSSFSAMAQTSSSAFSAISSQYQDSLSSIMHRYSQPMAYGADVDPFLYQMMSGDTYYSNALHEAFTIDADSTSQTAVNQTLMAAYVTNPGRYTQTDAEIDAATARTAATRENKVEQPSIKVADLQATYLMWVDCRTICNRLGISSAELSNRLRVDAHVWFCAGSIYGTEGEGFLRVNLACPRATLEEALTRFIAYVQ